MVLLFWVWTSEWVQELVAVALARANGVMMMMLKV